MQGSIAPGAGIGKGSTMNTNAQIAYARYRADQPDAVPWSRLSDDDRADWESNYPDYPPEQVPLVKGGQGRDDVETVGAAVIAGSAFAVGLLLGLLVSAVGGVL